ncbi:hypothetical protein ACSLBF_18730 (plasmid) [Pseudoalteromonas sp. T1lg65]|uniref:hypothetical protein n=1 Tax=Pseudoalteromonas sp. T1lg65 TaxID=2077101 RepID=UPI003F7987EA
MKLTKEELHFIQRILANAEFEVTTSDQGNDEIEWDTYGEIRQLLKRLSEDGQFSLVAKSNHEVLEFPLHNLQTLTSLLSLELDAPNIVEAKELSHTSWHTCPCTPVFIRIGNQFMPFSMTTISQSGGVIATFPFKAEALKSRLLTRIAKIKINEGKPLFANIESLTVVSDLQLEITFTLDEPDTQRLKAFILHHYVEKQK